MPLSPLPLATLERTRAIRRSGAGLFWLAMGLLIVAAGGGWLVYVKFFHPHRGSVAQKAAATTDAPPVANAEPQPDGAVPPASPVEPAATTSATPPPTAASNTTPTAPPAPEARPAESPANPAALETDATFKPRPPRDVFEAQIALTRDAICPGSIDGAFGGQTRSALAAYQRKHNLRVTGQIDLNTREALRLMTAPLAQYTITADDLARLRPLPKGWLARSQLDRLDFSTALELVAEKHKTNPKQIVKLNPGVDWTRITAGTTVVVPRVTRSPPSARPDSITISLSAKTLELLDAEGNILAHFPCSIARKVEKRPVGDLEVVAVAPNPNYTFDPANFPDSIEAQQIGRKLVLKPGPNNPVGIAWISLNVANSSVTLSNFGIHGSPEPEQIGRTESSGCFRLANWNAEYLLPLVRVGMRVVVEP